MGLENILNSSIFSKKGLFFPKSTLFFHIFHIFQSNFRVILQSKNMKSKRTKATDISMAVKKRVWERDNGRCVVCGNSQNVMPNAHYISRSHGGKGIEQNIVTLCTNLTKNKCHYRFDSGTKIERERLKKIIRTYLQSKYQNWNEENLTYKKNYL